MVEEGAFAKPKSYNWGSWGYKNDPKNSIDSYFFAE